MSNVTLFCLIQGDNLDNIFKVEIKTNKSVNDLKEVIRKKKPDAFDKVDIKKLWKVNISLEENVNKINILKTQPCASIKRFKGEELNTTKKVVEYFSNKFSNKYIH